MALKISKLADQGGVNLQTVLRLVRSFRKSLPRCCAGGEMCATSGKGSASTYSLPLLDPFFVSLCAEHVGCRILVHKYF